MKKIVKLLSSACLLAVCGAAFTACDDWTEPKSVDLSYGTIDKADPVAYAKYLENLRAYRTRPHKAVYAWVENVPTGFPSQGARLTALPDSVDVVVINNPASVTNEMIEEMDAVRKDKGMQIMYSIDFAAIKADWTLLCEELAAKRLAYAAENGDDAEIPSELQDPTFTDYMTRAWETQLKHFNTVGFDGILFAFDGKLTAHMTPAELAAYKAEANIFLGILADWHKRNPQAPIDFMGVPANIADNALLADFRTVFLSQANTANSESSFSMALAQAVNYVPVEKIGVAASMHALDTNADPKTGFFADGSLAVDRLANWASSQTIGAVGVYNATNDYYISSGKYSHVRNLIKSVNPIAK